MTEGRSRYNAAVVEVSKRMSHGIGGRFSYTYSVLKDNQVGETNFYSAGQPGAAGEQLQLSRIVAGVRGGQAFTSACYDPLRSTGYSLLDVPHRVIIAPIVELPFGAGRKWGESEPCAD